MSSNQLVLDALAREGVQMTEETLIKAAEVAPITVTNNGIRSTGVPSTPKLSHQKGPATPEIWLLPDGYPEFSDTLKNVAFRKEWNSVRSTLLRSVCRLGIHQAEWSYASVDDCLKWTPSSGQR